MTRVTVYVIGFSLFLLSPLHSTAREPVKPTFDDPKIQELVNKAWGVQEEELSIETIDAAIGYLEQALALDPENHVLLYMLSNEYSQKVYRLPNKTKKEKEAQTECAQKGYEYGMLSLVYQETAPGYFWAASNHAFRMQHKNFAAQLAMSPELVNLVNKAEALDITYFYWVSARLRSQLALVTPKLLLKLIGGTVADIEEKLNSGIAMEPRYIENYVDKAAFFRHVGRKKEALEVLEQALQIDPDSLPDMKCFNRFVHERAKKLWKEWTGKKYQYSDAVTGEVSAPEEM